MNILCLIRVNRSFAVMLFENILISVGIIIAIIFILAGIRIIRPTHRAAIERLGKYTRFQNSGITWIIPGIEKNYTVNITEQLTEAERQEIITLDNLNAQVSAQVYFKVNDNEENIKAALYNVYDYHNQIIALARTTLRNVIGGKNFADVNNKRNELNGEIQRIIGAQTKNWGIDIVRVELKEIEPPQDVQETMNKVLKAQNEKQAAIDFATATETRADGEKRAKIKEAEGQKQSVILKAEGEASAIKKVAEAQAEQIKLVNEAAERYFTGNAQLLKQFEVNRDALQENSKVVIVEKGISPVMIIGDDRMVVPLGSKSPVKES